MAIDIERAARDLAIRHDPAAVNQQHLTLIHARADYPYVQYTYCGGPSCRHSIVRGQPTRRIRGVRNIGEHATNCLPQWACSRACAERMALATYWAHLDQEIAGRTL